MTREEILNMSAGKKLDWEIAKLMGVSDKMFRFAHDMGNFNYSSNISAAWEVEEKIKELRIHVGYTGALKRVVVGEGDYVGMFDFVHATPEQRCKAALLVVLGEEEAK